MLQNVKFDSTNGKMYEELGSTTTDTSVTLAVTSTAATSALDYYQSYQNYPYSQQYMTGFTYPNSNYNYPYNSSQFASHSAINLSVKSGEDLPNSTSYLESTFGSSMRTQTGLNSSPAQILDLTRQTTGSSLLSYSPTPSAQQSTTAKSVEKQQPNKVEQTEPMDFSSNPSMSSFSRGSTFDPTTSAFGRSDLSRFRTPSYSSFGLGASYNSLLSNGYSSTGYSPYGQSSYSCLNYTNSAFPSGAADPTSFSLSSALTGTGSAGYGLKSIPFKDFESESFAGMSLFHQGPRDRAKMEKS